MTLPKELPMEHGSTTSEIYVRDCYPPYYKRIARMMEDRTTGGITITGTPGATALVLVEYLTGIPSDCYHDVGIGKSVFFRNSEILRKVDSGTDAMMTRACLQAQTEAPSGVFYLYDGPPQVYPRRARMQLGLSELVNQRQVVLIFVAPPNDASSFQRLRMLNVGEAEELR
ncbi:hypothetical protein AM587_10011531 [Phytophthora nicotianae]|uniref:Uncharacterized protein n=1 Tax=Phytophthora nicotianae TaxID=4792 RepID=A0A0W8CNR8_PHYNI|nr:hypothetical protein AM587_10011531 [Phytophthora nicotianae]